MHRFGQLRTAGVEYGGNRLFFCAAAMLFPAPTAAPLLPRSPDTGRGSKKRPGGRFLNACYHSVKLERAKRFELSTLTLARRSRTLPTAIQFYATVR
jgi:hypothetical protein